MLTALLLQATLIGPLTFPVPVSLPALLVIVVGIYAGPGVGVGLGFSTGLLADLGSDNPAGVQALCFLGAGLVAGIARGPGHPARLRHPRAWPRWRPRSGPRTGAGRRAAAGHARFARGQPAPDRC